MPAKYYYTSIIFKRDEDVFSEEIGKDTHEIHAKFKQIDPDTLFEAFNAMGIYATSDHPPIDKIKIELCAIDEKKIHKSLTKRETHRISLKKMTEAYTSNTAECHELQKNHGPNDAFFILKFRINMNQLEEDFADFSEEDLQDEIESNTDYFRIITDERVRFFSARVSNRPFPQDGGSSTRRRRMSRRRRIVTSAKRK